MHTKGGNSALEEQKLAAEVLHGQECRLQCRTHCTLHLQRHRKSCWNKGKPRRKEAGTSTACATGPTLAQLASSSTGTCQKRGGNMAITTTLLANIWGRESSRASTTARLSCRFTTRSSGSGRNGSSMSDTTCSHYRIVESTFELQ